MHWWVLAGIVIFGMLGFAWLEVRRKRHRKQFSEERVPLPDAEFAHRLGVETGTQTAYAVAVRKAVAGMCRVPAELIRPGDEMRQLCRLMFDGWDQIEFLFRLEDELECEFPDFEKFPSPNVWLWSGIWRRSEEQTLSEWVRTMIPHLDEEFGEASTAVPQGQ